ncbi:glycosyltransferase family 39 protein [Massilia sp. HP4]|uniref:DUF7024 domain-containing protein n=1 Tax=Massilia sp. HP4 TaxID=2562316 RepID=UPI0010BF69EF|nr:glycosyltransferase family 39 protein [Massilia sp. HP4]
MTRSVTDLPTGRAAGSLRRHAWEVALGASLLAAGLFLFQRNYGLYPSVFADEWYYSKMTRLEPFEVALVPSWLYLWLMRILTEAGGERFLEAVRLGNLAFLLGSAAVLYATARRFASRPMAYAVAIASTLAPLNLYSAYFMPEMTYYFGFCLLGWIALTRAGWHWAVHAAVAGAVIGLMSLVKVHALFLLPGLCLFLAYRAWARPHGHAWIVQALGAAALAAASAVILKFGLGWLIAGDAGLHLFGQFYGRAATTATSSVIDLVKPALVVGGGHLATLTLLAALPLALLVYGMCTKVLQRPATAAGAANAAASPGALALYTFLMLGSAGGLTVLYTASLNFMGHDELMRLHLRYYSFVFPLLWLAAGAAAGDAVRRAPLLRWALALGLCLGLLMALRYLPGYRMLMVDGPDIAGIDLAHPGTMALALLQGALLLGWAAGLRATPLLFVIVALPATLVATQVGVAAELEAQRTASAADLGGQAARRLVPPAERANITLVGQIPGNLMRAQFQIDDPKSSLLVLPWDGALSEEQVPTHGGWLLLIGENALPKGLDVREAGPGYRLIKLRSQADRLKGREIGQARLDEGFKPGLLEGIDGFSHAEQWGRWSTGKQVTLRFAQPLPPRAALMLEGQAFGVNATLPFVLRAGDASVNFRISGSAQEIGLRLLTDGTVRSIVIEIPQPQSPADLGYQGDARQLGIGLVRVRLIDLDQAP